MKKTLFSFVFLLALTFNSFSQICTPGNYQNNGVYPDTITNLLPGAVSQYYHTTITAKFPSDTTISGVTVTIDSVGVTHVYDLPTGFSWAANTNSGYFLGGTSGCIAIYGNPSAGQEGTYPIKIRINACGQFFGSAIQYPDTLTGYKIVIYDETHVGIVDTRKYNFDIIESYPNPAQQFSNITITSKEESNAKVSVMNLIGSIVFVDKVKLFPGENYYKLNTNSLGDGVYFICVDNGLQKITKKIIVSH